MDTHLLDTHFPRYTKHEPLVPVWCVTPHYSGCFHRFFDTSPVSPSGRYVAVTHYHDDLHVPAPGDAADVLLVDLHTGEEKIIAETHGWDTQLGAQAQWGPTDETLYFNDMDIDEWRPYGMCVNPITGVKRKLEGTVYMVSPDGTRAASPCLLRTGATQLGYGVVAPKGAAPVNHGAAEDDGLYMTDTVNGKCRMIVSFAQIYDAIKDSPDAPDITKGDLYGFHVKWNPHGTRLMYVVRWKPHDGGRIIPRLITMTQDGEDIHIAIPGSEWGVKHGHHPQWCPDGEHVIMNMNYYGNGMLFVSALYDGSNYHIISEKVAGSGHPTLHPDGRHILTDVYEHEPRAYEDGTAPLRWIDTHTETEKEIVRIQVRPSFHGERKSMRVDPHPAWDTSHRYITFNGCDTYERRVYIADLTSLLQ